MIGKLVGMRGHRGAAVASADGGDCWRPSFFLVLCYSSAASLTLQHHGCPDPPLQRHPLLAFQTGRYKVLLVSTGSLVVIIGGRQLGYGMWHVMDGGMIDGGCCAPTEMLRIFDTAKTCTSHRKGVVPRPAADRNSTIFFPTQQRNNRLPGGGRQDAVFVQLLLLPQPSTHLIDDVPVEDEPRSVAFCPRRPPLLLVH